jgi:hypothetical protein
MTGASLHQSIRNHKTMAVAAGACVLMIAVILARTLMFPGPTVLACGGDVYEKRGEVLFWDVASMKECFRVSHAGCAMFSVSYSGDGKRVATGGSDGKVYVWQVPASCQK